MQHPAKGETAAEQTDVQGEEKERAFHDCPFKYLASLRDRGDRGVAICGEREALRFNELFKITDCTLKDLVESGWALSGNSPTYTRN
jgi:hypothetical protein